MHSCPICDEACSCNGDLEDVLIDGGKEQEECIHCDDEDDLDLDDEDDDFFDEDEDEDEDDDLFDEDEDEDG